MKMTLVNTTQEQVSRIIKNLGEHNISSIYLDNKNSVADITIEAPIVGITYKNLESFDGIRTVIRANDTNVTLKGFVTVLFNESENE